MTQTILIFGKSGQVATELARATWPFEAHLEMAGRDKCDLSTAKICRHSGRDIRNGHRP